MRLFFSSSDRIERMMSKPICQCSNYVRVSKPSCKFYGILLIIDLFFINSKLTNLIKLRETTKTSWLECALAIFQARYAACPPVVGGNRRVSLCELCVLSAFLFYARPDVNRNRMMKQPRLHRCRRIIVIIMLVPI
jgi:hypothetical protein